ncbi:unnamed protein product, partial [Staurois parvus]
PWAIGDHGAPVSLPKLKKAYEKGIRGISPGPSGSFQMVIPPLTPSHAVSNILIFSELVLPFLIIYLCVLYHITSQQSSLEHD